MSGLDQRPISLEEYNSQAGADYHFQMVSQQAPSTPMQYQIVDQMVVGRQMAGVPQQSRINSGPTSGFKWENDFLRSAIDDRIAGESRMEPPPPTISAAAMAMLPGMEQVSF